MKVLIWFGCIFVATILNTLLGELTGIKAGYLVFYFGVYFVARKLCQKWDEHQEAKVQQKQSKDNTNENGVSLGTCIGVDVGNNQPAASGWKCACGRAHPPYETACICGRSKFEAVEQAKPIVAITQSPAASSQESDKIRFCRRCGEELIDGSRFCRKCGTQVVDKVVWPAE